MTLAGFKQRFWGALRVQLYVLCVGAALAYASFVHAYDHAEQTLGELGFDMLSGLGALERGVEQVELNGQSFTFAATALSQPPESVIAEFEEHCARGADGLAGDVAGLVAYAKEHGHPLPDDDPSRWLTRTERASSNQSAHSSCFVRADSASGDLWASLMSFAETGKLGSLGGFRYVRADRASGADATRVLAIASDGDFDVDALVPDAGDASGRDPRVTPRPLDSERRFSARIARSGHGAYVYTSRRPPAEILGQYDRELSKLGLPRVALPTGDANVNEYARTYAAGDGAVIVSVTQDGAEVQVAIFELGELPAAEGG